MAEKEKLPFWMGVVLGMLLGIMLVLIIIVPQIEHAPNNTSSNKITATNAQPTPMETKQTKQTKQTKLPQQQYALAHPVAAQPAHAPSLHEPAPHDQQQASTKQAPPAIVQPLASPQSTPAISTSKQQTSVSTKPASASAKIPHTSSNQGIALVLDDVGYDLDALKRLLRLSVPIAISVLPDAPYARQAAELARQAGQIVMLHLPMQPEDPSLQIDDAFLRDNMSDQVLRDTFLRDLKKVPYVTGVNNHMGSKLTQLNIPMQTVMRVCQEKGLFFIDSRTSKYSVAAKVAEKAGLAWASRSIFLDHEMTLAAMKHAWNRARTCAKKHLSCIVIAHPRPKTVAFLENYLSKADATHMVAVTTLLRTAPAILAQAKKPAL